MSLCMGCMKEKGNVPVCPHCGLNEADLSAASNMFLPPGTVLKERYKVGIALGQGGFGITYIGYDNILSTRVAIKEYYPSDIAQRYTEQHTVQAYSHMEEDYDKGKERFIEEARTLAKFADHPCVVGVKDCFNENGTAYMVMEFLDGVDLKEYIKRKGNKLGVEESISLLTPIMDALRAVHKEGIIHRDISPDNIFITMDGRIRLIDFGAARQSFGGERSLSIMLKPGYAPEEQYRKRGNQGPWTDVYALTATLYRMITGSVPPDSLERLVDDDLYIPQDLPPHIQSALHYGLAVRATDRFSNIHQLQHALQGEIKTPPPKPQDRPTQEPKQGGIYTPPYTPPGSAPYGQPGTTQNTPPYPPQQGGSGNKILITIISIATFCIVILIIAMMVIAIKPISNNNTTTTTTQTQTTVEPEPEPEPPKVHSYEIVVSRVTWEAARAEAESRGGHLATINDQEEYNKLKSMLSGYSKLKNVWIGACAPSGISSYSEAQSYWYSSEAKWITGEPFNFSDWRKGEPSGYDANLGNAERYVQLFKPKADGVWSFNDAGSNLSEYKSGTLGYIIEWE